MHNSFAESKPKTLKTKPKARAFLTLSQKIGLKPKKRVHIKQWVV